MLRTLIIVAAALAVVFYSGSLAAQTGGGAPPVGRQETRPADQDPAARAEEIQKRLRELEEEFAKISEPLQPLLKEQPIQHSPEAETLIAYEARLTELQDKFKALGPEAAEKISEEFRILFTELAEIWHKKADYAMVKQGTATNDSLRNFWAEDQKFSRASAAEDEARAVAALADKRRLGELGLRAVEYRVAVDGALCTIRMIKIGERADQAWAKYRDNMKRTIADAAKLLEEYVRALADYGNKPAPAPPAP